MYVSELEIAPYIIITSLFHLNKRLEWKERAVVLGTVGRNLE